jgi:uncharacterized protein YheU (UPF0270 family)|tara:strand:- start:119542 stop:119802 length:261 start_codon:yes stop_codon:yes gene_type:complete
MIIPEKTLKKEVLESLLEEIVTRDGTDYGEQELSTEQKVNNALRALEQGRMKLLWDAEIESASLVTSEKAKQLLQAKALLDSSSSN